jgi:hypothetical protein
MSGSGRSVTPTRRRNWLMTPSRPSSTIHAYVRTSEPVK